MSIEKAQGWVGTAGEFNLSSRDHCGLDKDKSLEMCTVKAGKIYRFHKTNASRPIQGQKWKVVWVAEFRLPNISAKKHRHSRLS